MDTTDDLITFINTFSLSELDFLDNTVQDSNYINDSNYSNSTEHNYSKVTYSTDCTVQGRTAQETTNKGISRKQRNSSVL